MHESTPATCLNCATELEGAYCHTCGQRADTERLTMRRLWGQVFQAFVDVDRGFLYTVKVLTVAPGRAVKDYLAGQRAPMYNPFRWYILIAAAMLIVMELSDFRIAESSTAMQQSMGNTEVTQKQAAMQKALNTWMQENMQTVQLAALPLIAWGMWIAFRRFLAINYAEALVLQCYVSGYGSLVMIPFIPFIGSSSSAMVTFSLVGIGVSLLVTIRFVSGYVGRLSLGVVLRSLAALLLYMLAIMLMSVVVGIIVAVVMQTR